MTSFQIFFSILAAVLYLVWFVPYIYHVFHGRVVPHAFSWTIWAIISTINTITLVWSMGDTFAIFWPMVRTGALIFGAIIAWIYIGKIRINSFDYLCLLLGLFCVVIAYVYGVADAIIPTIIVDIIVLSPTLRKIWRDPDTEDAFTWFLVMLSQGCILLSLPVHTLENSLFWWYVMTVNALVALLILRRRVYTHRWSYRMRQWLGMV